MVIPAVPCRGCGLCCIDQDTLPIDGTAGNGGRCVWLTENNECRYYKNRPAMCREFKRDGDECLERRARGVK